MRPIGLFWQRPPSPKIKHDEIGTIGIDFCPGKRVNETLISSLLLRGERMVRIMRKDHRRR